MMENKIEDDIERLRKIILLLENETGDPSGLNLDAIERFKQSGLITPMPQRFEALLNQSQGPEIPALWRRHLPVVNVHVRKAAGTAFLAAMVCNGYLPFFLRHHTDKLELSAPPWNAYGRNQLLSFYKSLLLMREAKYASPIYSGHIASSHEIFTSLPGEYACVTVLREPVKLLISMYLYTKKHNSTRPESALAKISFIDYARSIVKDRYPGMGMQWRMFAPPSVLEPTPEDSFRYMIENIGYFGLSDDMFETMFYLSYILPMTNPLYHYSINKTDDLPPKTGMVSDARPQEKEIEAVRELLSDDIWFYEKCREVSELRKREIRDKFDVSEDFIEECRQFSGSLLQTMHRQRRHK